LEITLDKHSSNQASIKIKLEEADYQSKVDAKVKDYAKKANIKGFRPGKAPIAMVKNLYGTSVLVDEINNILSTSLNDYIKQQEFRLLGDPLPVLEAAEGIDWKKQKEFEFEYKIGFLENLTVQVDDAIQAKTYLLEVDEKEINDAVSNLRRQYGKMTNPEVSQENDFIYGDLKSEDGSFEKTLSLPLSKLNEDAVKDFVGLKKDDEVKFDPKKAIKEDLAEVLNLEEEEAAAISGEYIFTVQNINRTEDAEMNQEFFDKVFGQDQVASEEEFFNKAKEILQENYNKEARVFSEEKIKDVVVEHANIDLPEQFLKEWLARTNEGKVSDEDIEREYPLYAKQMTWTLIANKIAEDNDLKVEHEDILEKTKEMIREQLGASGLGSQMEDSMDMFAENYLQGKDGQNYMQMHTSAQNDKVLDFVKEKISVTEEKISVEDFKKLLEN
jgi:trigger factor